MTADDRVFATPPGVPLGPLAIVADGAARNFVLQLRAGRFHGFVVRQGAQVFGYVDRCPHMGVLLAQVLDAYLTPRGDFIACSWHSALFAIETGLCVGGPCTGQRLTPWPVAAIDGIIVTARRDATPRRHPPPHPHPPFRSAVRSGSATRR